MGIADEIKGPVDLVLLSFPGNQFTGEIAPALGDLVSSGTVRILDLVFITKDADGNVAGVELADLGDAGEAFESLDGEVSELLTDEDIEAAGEELEPNSSAALLMFENTWAGRFVDAVRGANGHVVAYERIGREALDEFLAAVKRLNGQHVNTERQGCRHDAKGYRQGRSTQPGRHDGPYCGGRRHGDRGRGWHEPPSAGQAATGC